MNMMIRGGKRLLLMRMRSEWYNYLAYSYSFSSSLSSLSFCPIVNLRCSSSLQKVKGKENGQQPRSSSFALSSHDEAKGMWRKSEKEKNLNFQNDKNDNKYEEKEEEYKKKEGEGGEGLKILEQRGEGLKGQEEEEEEGEGSKGQNLYEYFDVFEPPLFDSTLDVFRIRRTDSSKPRGRIHSEGKWHSSVHLWIVDYDNEILLQRRSQFKDTHPNLWDVSCAGHIETGDEPFFTVLREIEEELRYQVPPLTINAFNISKNCLSSSSPTSSSSPSSSSSSSSSSFLGNGTPLVLVSKDVLEECLEEGKERKEQGNVESLKMRQMRLMKSNEFSQWMINQIVSSAEENVAASAKIQRQFRAEKKLEEGRRGEDRFPAPELFELFVATAKSEGKTQRHGKFVDREYQWVYVLRFPVKLEDLLQWSSFRPFEEEVSDLRIISSISLRNELLKRNLQFVPRSEEYTEALVTIIEKLNDLKGF